MFWKIDFQLFAEADGIVAGNEPQEDNDPFGVWDAGREGDETGGGAGNSDDVAGGGSDGDAGSDSGVDGGGTGAYTVENVDDDPVFRERLGQVEARHRAELAELKKQLAESEMLPYKGQFDTYNQKTIETFDDYMAFKKASQAEALKAAGLSPEYIKSEIENHPDVLAARQIAARQKKAEAERFIDAQVSEIGKLYPDIKSANDLGKLPNKEAFDDLVFNRGYSLIDAFKLSHFDMLRSGGGGNYGKNLASKKHLVTIGGASGSGDDIPPDLLRDYMDMGYTKEQAMKHHKGFKRN
jgi:hypothetical protein